MCDMFLMLKTVYTLFSYKQNFYKQHQAEIDKNQANAKQRDWNFAVSKLFTFFIHVKNKCVCIHEIVRLIIMKMKILLLLFTSTLTFTIYTLIWTIRHTCLLPACFIFFSSFVCFLFDCFKVSQQKSYYHFPCVICFLVCPVNNYKYLSKRII